MYKVLILESLYFCTSQHSYPVPLKYTNIPTFVIEQTGMILNARLHTYEGILKMEYNCTESPVVIFFTNVFLV